MQQSLSLSLSSTNHSMYSAPSSPVRTKAVVTTDSKYTPQKGKALCLTKRAIQLAIEDESTAKRSCHTTALYMLACVAIESDLPRKFAATLSALGNTITYTFDLDKMDKKDYKFIKYTESGLYGVYLFFNGKFVVEIRRRSCRYIRSNEPCAICNANKHGKCTKNNFEFTVKTKWNTGNFEAYCVKILSHT